MISSMGSSYEIIGTLGVITLGGATVTSTPGGDTGIVNLRGAIVGTSLGNTLVWVFSSFMLLNNIAILSMACSW